MNSLASRCFFLTLCTALLRSVAGQIDACGSQCKFRLCGPFGVLLFKGPRILIRAPKRVSFGSICEQGKTLGYVRRTGEAIVELNNGEGVRISKWRPKKLSPKLPKKLFKASRNRRLRTSGISNLRLRGNQQKFVENLCIRLPIKTYELVDRRTRRVKNVVRTDGTGRDCVSFRSRTTKILIELTWNSGDDFDLIVNEPGGSNLSRFNRETRTGRLLDDVNDDGCAIPLLSGRETARYLSSTEGVRSGIYSIEIRQFKNCGRGGTKWRLEVSIDGKTVQTKQGRSNANLDKVVGRSRFRYF